MARGFMYLMAIIDWFSRYVLAWKLSNSLDGSFCVDALQQALAQGGKPEIFNTDQGAQFTSVVFTDVLLHHQVAISMDGRGRVFDNIFIERLWRTVKYELIYLHDYPRGQDLQLGLQSYLPHDNTERPHQSLGYQTPAAVYFGHARGAALEARR
jgi:putative transposase